MGPAGEATTQQSGRRAMDQKMFGYPPEPTDELRAVFGEPPRPTRIPGTKQLTRRVENGDWDKMIKGMNENTPEGVSQLSKDLMGTDKEAFPSIVKKEGMNALESSQDKANWMEDFTDKMYGRSPQLQTRARFTEKIRGVAENQGRKPHIVERYVKEATELYDAIQMASKNQDIIGRMNEVGMLQQAGRNPVSEGLRSANVVAPLWRTGSAIERAVSAKTLETIVKAVSEPGGEKLLIDIAKFGSLDHKSKALVQALMASRAGAGTAGQ